MILWGISRFESILGIVVTVIKIFNREKLFRKKYMGVCRWLSVMIMIMMIVFFMKARR